MRRLARLAAVPAALFALGGLGLAGASSASAATVNFTFCNNASGVVAEAIFPQRGGFSTFVLSPGECNPTWTGINPGEPYVVRFHQQSNWNVYKDIANHWVWSCNERVAAVGNYGGSGVSEQCV
ncbi:hypothetical protein GCM10022223_41170 [Kineosporia mesophila]|uniref:Uncharacterized protein n=1 Tax=Kineosporia mesophila TaxID=566012 RepID=A0ABP6ZVA8_9ACTN|nr:hypothetical protein [Kineosporia mesophila]MCD5348732.1 hypothetical protein [Kineosporia mesophila]